MASALPIIAYSACCATGMTVDQVMDTIFSGETGLQPPGDRAPAGAYLGSILEPLPGLPEEFDEYDCRQGRLAMHSVRSVSDTIRDLVERRGRQRVAVLVGTSTGGLAGTEDAYPNFGGSSDGDGLRVETQHAFSAAADLIAAYFDILGPTFSVSTACSSSAKIIGSARRMIDAGFIDAAVLVGVDTLCQTTIRGFGGLKLLARDQCRPFDAARDGINIGEAGAAMVVEADASRADYGIWGIGEVNGGYHMTRPHPDGIGAAGAMREAIADADISPGELAAVSSHGTATLHNDSVESKAIVDICGGDVPVFSTKGQTGHTLGACGALETIIAIESLKRELMPGTYGLRELDGEIEANINRDVRQLEGDYILSNSLAFGDNNASVVVGRL